MRPQLPGPADWQPLPPDSLATLVEQARLRHPELQKSRAKLAQLGVGSRLLQVGPLFGAETGLVLNSA